MSNTKQDLIEATRSGRASLEAVLAKIPPERLADEDAVGAWSVKDVLAHIAVWAARTVTMLFQAERGQAPSMGVPDDSKNDWVNVNAKDYASQKDRPAERVLEDFRGSHKQLIKRLEGWTDDAALFDKQRYPALKGQCLADYVRGNGIEHDAEHQAQIEAWLAKAP